MTFADKLAAVLTPDISLSIYHVSSPPTRCTALFSAPPSTKPEKTFCEKHFLTVSAPRQSPEEDEILLFAIEVLVYTTAHLTTLFVSKADSTGYIKQLLPKASPIKAISTTFLEYLADKRQRDGTRLVISLFARAQDQYLFPGSIEHSGKHVLDDRSLIKWWCRILDPVLRTKLLESESSAQIEEKGSSAFLIVPGCDNYETLSFLPTTARSEPPPTRKWHIGHPLYHLSPSPNASPRCLIPHFPDDPKTRFLDELDEEIAITEVSTQESPTKRSNYGIWKSVKTLEQFWEMMAFRQECSSGRVVGFIWLVLSPRYLNSEGVDSQANSQELLGLLPNFGHPVLPTLSRSHDIQAPLPPLQASIGPLERLPSDLDLDPPSDQGLRIRSNRHPKKPSRKVKPRKRKLTGPIVSRMPRIKKINETNLHDKVPERTKYFVWPKNSRGQVVLSDDDYNRVHEFLLHLDFANAKVAAISTKKWIKEVSSIVGGREWGQRVKGRKVLARASLVGDHQPVVNNQGSGLVKKRKQDNAPQTENSSSGVNMLSGGLVRKKARTGDVTNMPFQETPSKAREVNILGSGFIRKKEKG
ncbi:MAG: hypothetical protein M1834_005162 [Cirrosporium novae-zelandiae]|nr:MAG: hypothetical protein M1834_005162 [Cirrosporium novae-zelandiae]